jgi:hypothetical protein
MRLTLRGQLLLVVLLAVVTILLGTVMSYASGREPLPDPPGSYTAVTSR